MDVQYGVVIPMTVCQCTRHLEPAICLLYVANLRGECEIHPTSKNMHGQLFYVVIYIYEDLNNKREVSTLDSKSKLLPLRNSLKNTIEEEEKSKATLRKKFTKFLILV